MAISNYTELQAAVANWMHRTNLTGDIPDFITLAEDRIRARLASRLQGSVVQIPTTAGVQYAAIPGTVLRIRSLSIPGVQPKLDYMSPDVFNQQFGMEVAGTPRCYSIIGERIYLGPTPDAVYTIHATQSAEFEALSDGTPSNTLLANWPSVYLWGALVEAAKFSSNDRWQEKYNQSFAEAVEGVNLTDWNAAGTIAARSDGSTP
jgi:hypothetical protein